MWRNELLVFAIIVGAPGAAAAQVSPEHAFRPGTVALTVSAGGAAFTDFQRVMEQPDTGSGSFGRRLSAGTTGAVGADLSWWVRRTWGVRAHASYMPSRFAVQYDRAGEAWLRAQSGSPQTPSYARLRIWAADLSFLARPQIALGRVAPYAIAGAGLVSYRPQSRRSLPPEAVVAFSSGARTVAAGVVGLGALVPLERGNMRLSFVLTDHITSTPVAEPESAASYRDRLNRSVLRPDEQYVRLTNNVRLMMGLMIPLRSR